MKVLITGSSSGIGYAITEICIERGMDVIAVSRRKPALSKSQLARVDFHSVDLSKRSNVERWIASQSKILNTVDVLINNAGLAKGLKSIQDVDPDEWDTMIDTNLKGLLHMTRAVLPGMIARDRGHVINLGSIAGRWVYPKGNVYCATKHAVHALTEALRMDLFGTAIRVTEIIPGMVDTGFSEVRLGSKEAAQKVYAGMRALTPRDIAETVLWAMDRPAHVNIQEIVVMPTDQASFG